MSVTVNIGMGYASEACKCVYGIAAIKSNLCPNLFIIIIR